MPSLVLKKTSGRGFPTVVAESDTVVISGLERSASGAASIYTDANTTTITLGGGAAQGVVTLGKTGVANKINGWLNTGSSAAATANGDLSSGDGTRSFAYTAATNRIDLAGGSATISSAANALAISSTSTITIGSASTSLTCGNTTNPTNLQGSAVQVNSLPLPSIVSTTPSVDLKTVANTTLYTVPTGKTFYFVRADIVPTTATTPNGNAVVSLGTNGASYNDIISSETLTGLTTTTELYALLAGSGVIHKAVATETVRLNVTTGDTGTALTATVYLLGYLV